MEKLRLHVLSLLIKEAKKLRLSRAQAKKLAKKLEKKPSSSYILTHAHAIILLPWISKKIKCAHTHTTGAQKYHFSTSLLQCTLTLTHTHTHCLPRRSTGLGQHNCLPFHPPCKSPVQNVAKQHSTGGVHMRNNCMCWDKHQHTHATNTLCHQYSLPQILSVTLHHSLIKVVFRSCNILPLSKRLTRKSHNYLLSTSLTSTSSLPLWENADTV